VRDSPEGLEGGADEKRDNKEREIYSKKSGGLTKKKNSGDTTSGTRPSSRETTAAKAGGGKAVNRFGEESKKASGEPKRWAYGRDLREGDDNRTNRIWGYGSSQSGIKLAARHSGATKNRWDPQTRMAPQGIPYL